MSTPRKSTSNMAPSTPRRPCTPENAHGQSPRAPGPPGSPDRRLSTSDRPSKSYLRPTVSSTMHHGTSNTYQPRKSIDKPPFLPPSSVGVHSQHHKNPSSSSSKSSSLSLKGILTRATNAMKVGGDKYRKSGTSAGVNVGKGSGANTPVRPRSPANNTVMKRKDLARSNSVPKKLSAGKKSKERDTMSICSIEDTLPENLPDPQIVIQSAVPDRVEKTENTEGNLIEESEAPKEGLKEVLRDGIVAEESREEQVKINGDDDVKEDQVKTTNNVEIGEKQEDQEAHKMEPVNIVVDDEVDQEIENIVTVSEQKEEEKIEEAVTELAMEQEEKVIAVNAEEENKADDNAEEEENKADDNAEEVIVAELNNEAAKEDVEENVASSVETPKEAQNGTAAAAAIEENFTVEEKPIPATETETETEVKKTEEAVVQTEDPKVEEKPETFIVSEPKKDKTAVRKPDAVATRREGAISNDVIEETKSKLMEKRKNKVLALVGAFETVMQKPDEGSTTRR